MVDYTKQTDEGNPHGASPYGKKTNGRYHESDSDTDFQAPGEESDGEDALEDGDQVSAQELEGPPSRHSQSVFTSQTSPIERETIKQQRRPSVNFKRAEMPLTTPIGVPLPSAQPSTDGSSEVKPRRCIACNQHHATGYCPLKLAGVEHCQLCGLAHYGNGRTCAHLNSVTQLRAMVEAIKQSNEPEEIKVLAKKRTVGIIGDLNQRKRRKVAEAEAKLALLDSGKEKNAYRSIYGREEGGFGDHSVAGTGVGKENVTLDARTQPESNGHMVGDFPQFEK